MTKDNYKTNKGNALRLQEKEKKKLDKCSKYSYQQPFIMIMIEKNHSCNNKRIVTACCCCCCFIVGMTVIIKKKERNRTRPGDSLSWSLTSTISPEMGEITSLVAFTLSTAPKFAPWDTVPPTSGNSTYTTSPKWSYIIYYPNVIYHNSNRRNSIKQRKRGIVFKICTYGLLIFWLMH